MKIFIATLFILLACSPVRISFAQCNPIKPKNLSLTNETGCEATLHWKAIPGIAFYAVKFKKVNEIAWHHAINVGLDTFYTFTGLIPNVQYTFAVASYCSVNSSSPFNKINTNGYPCSPPLKVTATINGPGMATISWISCGPSANNQLRYKNVGSTDWIYVFTGTAQSATVNISASVVYEATSCIDTTGHWSLADTLYYNTSSKKPSAIVILLDDSRYDTYSCNGAPSFFQSPNIDRIANEGVNFKNAFVIYSLCNPSRASILTGLYTNHNGALNNKDMFYSYLPTIGTVMDQAGYYTAFMGKYLNANDKNPVPQPGWDFWMARVGSGHKNATFNYNGTEKKMIGHVTDVLTDTAVALINKIAEPYLLYICYSATHNPYIPRSEDAHLYDDTEIPLPDNFYPYQRNYPDFLVESAFTVTDSAALTEDLRGYYEVMAGVDEDLQKIFEALESKNILDSTFIIFTSDNGYMMGEHCLEAKRLPHEESIRVPMFIRYPLWFPPGSINTSQMVLNIDIAPTLFDLAGVPDTIQLDGLSMHKIFDGETSRTSFYYQATHLNDSSVNCRSVRSLNYKYNYYYCDELTEEFFDLLNDPEENTNLINDSDHLELIEQYRIKMDSFKLTLDDTLPEDISSCYLAKPRYTRFADDHSDINTPLLLRLYPNPASEDVHFELTANKDAAADVLIYSLTGKVIFRQNNIQFAPEISVPLYLHDLDPGLYNVQVNFHDEVINKKLVIIR